MKPKATRFDKDVVDSISAPDVILRSTVAALLKNLLDIQNLGHHPRPTKLETALQKISRWLLYSLKSEKYGISHWLESIWAQI